MRLTINLPWLTYSRRLAVTVTASLLLITVAIPASAAPPEGMGRTVVVGNTSDNPVPVKLDPSTQGSLADIDAATSPLTYDESGNLKVNVAGGIPIPELQTAGSLFIATSRGLPPSGKFEESLDDDAKVTAIAFYASESITVQFMKGSEFPFAFRLDAGQTLTETFPFPFEADSFRMTNLSDEDNVTIWFSISGF